jgi:hypothetical protein
MKKLTNSTNTDLQITQTVDDCASQAGSAFLNGVCIYFPESDFCKAVLIFSSYQCFTIQVASTTSDFSQNIGQPVIDKLQSAPYNFNINHFLNNAVSHPHYL